MIYQNFDLEIIRPRGGDRLYARVLDSPQGDCPFVDVKWPFDTEQENKVLAQIYGDLRQRRGRSMQGDTIEDFGGKLFEAIFAGDIEHLFRSSLDSAYRNGKGLRIRLRLPDDSELHGRPWEFLFDTESREFLAVREHTPLVRYLPVAQPIPPITVEGPLRVLVALSSPADHPRLDTAREWEILRDALDAPIAAHQLELRRVPGRCTFDNLRDSLRHFRAHIFHFVGHGIPGALVLEQESGKGMEMEATHLRSAFPSGALPRLIVLNACSGATAEDVPFSGLAQGFLRQGVPAVVAMQASITDDAALIFTRYFYRDLVEIGAVDTSLTEARLRMQANGHPIEWGTPVLYMRALSGQLFQPIANPTPSPVEHEPPLVTPVKVDPPPSHVETMLDQHKKTRIRQEQKSAAPPSPKPATAGKRKPKPMRDRETASAPSSPAAGQNMQSAVQPGPITSPVPPKPQPAAPDIAPPIPVAAPVPRPLPKPAPPANDVTPKVAADKPAPLPKREPIVDEPVMSTIPLIVPEVAAAFTLQPEPPPLSRPPESDMPQHTAAIREPGPVQSIHSQRSRIYALAGGGLVVALAIGLGVNRDALFRSTSSDAAMREPTPAATAGSTLPSTAGTTSSTHTPSSSTGRAPLSAAAPEKTATSPPMTVENQALSITSGSGVPARDASSTARAAKPAPATDRSARRARAVVKPPAAAPIDKCSTGEVSERSAECVLRAPTQSEAANEIPSGE